LRHYFEALEENFIAPYAIKSSKSKGRKYDEPLCQLRTCFQRDRDRIIHAKSFRRLKHKTQVFLSSYSDHARSRLTHSIEVSQISRHIARLLKVNEDLAECIALAHDLGHPPFGHSGERALNILMTNNGGFEHNKQSVRVITQLEKKYPSFPGLNLSFEVVEGLKKHQAHVKDNATKKSFTSLESQIVNLADEIAYNNHDIDDGLTESLLNESDLDQHVSLWREAKVAVKSQYTNLPPQYQQHLINSFLISNQIINAFQFSQNQIHQHALSSPAEIQCLANPIIAFSPEMQEKNKELREFLFRYFYKHPRIYEMNTMGQSIINKLFNYYINVNLEHVLPTATSPQRISKARAICDYIAGMTDSYAEKLSQDLFPDP
jgi:dGTPase